MSLIESIQSKFLYRKALKDHKLINTEKAFVQLNKAKNIGIVCDFRDEKSKSATISLYKDLKKPAIRFKVLIFIPNKRTEINQYEFERLFPGEEVYLICPEDISLLGKPKKQVFSRFVQQVFDIVIRFDLEPKFEMDMVLLSTRSLMFAGIQNDAIPFYFP